MEEKESKEAGSPDMDGVEGEHMKAMWAGQSNVLVAVRVRPLMKHDVIKKSCVRVLDNKVVVILDPALAADKVDILRANRNREKQYAFDYVLDPTSTQDSAYLHTTKFLIHGVLDGFNATVFAYGQTGSGKTHTMIGSPSDPGIMVKVMEDLFIYSASQCKQQGNAHRIIVSFLEVYNENIRDLLSDVEEYLDLREDPIKGPVVSGITEVETKSSTEIMNLLHQGNAKRFQAATAANEVSSRSHAVLQVVVESKDRAPGVVANIKVGKLSLVDLAGSERAANTKNTGARLVEGANINRSLLALGNCINALGEKGNKGNFVPYRDSKLTRLLKDSLGGNCRTVMIANISSSESAFEETLNTLKYANRAKNIKTNVQRNVLNVNYHISEYVQLINNLRGEIKLLKDQISLGGIDPPIYGDVAKSFSRGGMGFGGLVANSISPQHGGNAGLRMPSSPPGVAQAIGLHSTTPLHILRESMRSATQGADREVVNSMRQKIVENFQERMQLRRSLIELEDQNVQNSIEVSKRQLIVVQWSETRGNTPGKKSSVESKGIDEKDTSNADFAADLIANGTSEIKEAWQECEQLRKAILKNNGMKKSIAKRLRHNEREAEKFRDELSTKITGEDRRELMELQYQVGRLELENMELEQHRIVHESILKGKDLVIQKLKLQLAVRDKLINRQQTVLKEHSLDDKVGYSQLALMEQTLMGDTDLTSTAPPSPPRNLNNAKRGDYGSGSKLRGNAPVVPMLDINHIFNSELNESIDSGYTMPDIKDVSLTDRDRESIEAGDWSEIHSELSDDASFHNGPMNISSFGSNSDNKNSHLSSNYGNKQPTGSKFTKQIERLERDRVDNYNNESKQLEINGKILRADLAIRAQRGGRLITRVNANNSNEMTPSGGNYGYNHMVNGVESNDSIGVLSGDKMVIEKPLRPQNPRKNHSFPDFNQFSETPVLEADAKYNSNVVGGKDMHHGDNKVDWDRDRVMREDKDYYLNNKGRRGQDIVNFNFGDIPLNISPDGKVLGLQHGRNQVNNEERDKELFERALENRQASNNNRNKVKGSNQNVSEWSDDNVPLSGRGRYNEIIANNTNNKFVHDEFGEDSIDTVLSDNSENSERHKGSHVKVVPFNSNNHNIVKENNMANLQLASNIYLQGGPALPSNSRADKNLALGKLKNKISSNVNNIEMNEIIGPANIIERPQNPPTHGLSINNIGFGGIGQILAPVTDRIVAAPNAAGIGGISRPLQYNKNKLSNANNRNIIKNNINNSLAIDSVVAGPVSNASISNSNTSVGGIVIPNIGGRNRSLPNLPKDRPQPLSARSQASKDYQFGMFSVGGKRRLLLDIKRAKTAGIDVSQLKIHKQKVSSSTDELHKKYKPLSINDVRDVEGAFPTTQASIASSDSKNKETKSKTVFSTKKILRLLHSEIEEESAVMTKLLDGTVRYRPDKDSLLLKPFESANLEYDLFRSLLRSNFELIFDENEYKQVINIFDKSSVGHIDGYQFIIAFIKLCSMKKDRDAEIARKKQAKFMKQLKAEEIQKQLEIEKRQELKVNFDAINGDDKAKAVSKFNQSCKDFDPAHPQSPSLDGLLGVPFVRPAELREIMKATFKLALTNKELGAILLEFQSSIIVREKRESVKSVVVDTSVVDPSAVNDTGPKIVENDPSLAETSKDADNQSVNSTSASSVVSVASLAKAVPLGDFIKFMIKRGIKLRDKERLENIKRQEELNNKARELAEKKQLDLLNKGSGIQLDFNYSELDQARAEEKLVIASTKYDKNAPGCPALDGFMCEYVTAGMFKELMKNVFNAKFNNKELAYLIKKYQVPEDPGKIPCSSFLNSFIKLGIEERHKHHLAQLEKKKQNETRMQVEHVEKMNQQVTEAEKSLNIDWHFSEMNIDIAVKKLTAAAVKYDKSRGASLTSFDPIELSPAEFKAALFRTFNLKFSPKELGALVCKYESKSVNSARNGGSGSINCKEFLNAFMQLGISERFKHQVEQIKKQKEAEEEMKLEHKRKLEAQSNKADIEISYDYNEDEEASAISKMTIAATKYDKNHPSALDTSGFEVKSMPATLFKEMVRRTFGLRLSPTESGALLHHLAKRLNDRGVGDGYYDGTVNCGEFLMYFLTLGIEERAKAHKAQLDKQLVETKKRQEDEKKKLDDMVLKPISIDKGYTQADIDSITAKLQKASEGFDKNHPAAPSLISFDAAYMTAGQLKENMKRTFNVKVSPKELAYLMSVYDPSNTGQISCGDFLIKFLALGKEIRDEKHKLQVQKQRDALIMQKKESEDKLNAQREASELKVDWDYTDQDKETGHEKLIIAAAKYDKSNASAPSTAGFTGGAMKPGEFNNLLRRTFNLWLTGKELATIVHEYKHADYDDQVDSKLFLVKFMKLGFDERARRKASKLDQIRTAAKEREIYLEKKKKLSESKTALHIDRDFFATDKSSAYRKLTIGAALYDRNSPGCASLDAFNAKYLTPAEFREQLKRTFNITLLPKELAAIIDDFCNGGLDQNVQSQKFLNTFLKLGSDERDKKHRVDLARQRREDAYRKNEHERAMKTAEDKINLKIDYNFDNEQQKSAFEKLNIAAKKYDKNSPGCLSLDGFTVKELNAVSFKEMLKRTFGMFDLTAGELGALMSFYDNSGKGLVSTKDFLLSFLQMGMNQRDKEKRDQLAKNKSIEELRKKEEEDKLQAQWAKLEIDVTKVKYSKTDIDSALEKLTDAATKFDAERAGPTALTAFDARTLSIAVFREMLKRVFNLKVTENELAYIAKVFSAPGTENVSSNASVSSNTSVSTSATTSNEVVCKDFLNKFLQLGIQKRHEFKILQLEKQRKMIEIAKEENVRKKLEADKKLDIKVDDSYTQQDYNSGMGKLRNLAANYQRGHPSAPSLDGFTGGGMLKPDEFRFLILRTFNETLSNMELSALVRFYDTEGQDMVDSNAFLTHFLKMQRLEQDKKRKEELRILRNREKQAQVEEDERVRREQQQEIEMIKYSNKDEISFIEKLRNIAQEYTVDSAVYNETMSAAFKGPALNAKSFRQIILRVFNVKFSFPEIGVLMSLLDKGGSGTIDGQYFLNWFYKFCRKEQRILLGEVEDDVSIQNIRSSMDSISDNASVGGFKPINSNSSTTSTLTGSYHRSNQVKIRDVNNDNVSVSSSQSSFSIASSRSLVNKVTHPSKSKSKSNKVSYPITNDFQSRPEEILTSKSLKSKWVLPTTAASMSIIDDDTSSLYGQQFRDELSEIMSQKMPHPVEQSHTNQVLPFDIYNDVYGGGMDRDLMSVGSMSTLSMSVSNLSNDQISTTKKPSEKKKTTKYLSSLNPSKMVITPLNSAMPRRTDERVTPGSPEEFFQKPKPEPKPVGVTQKIHDLNMLREKKLNRGGSLRSIDSLSSSSTASKSKDLTGFFLPAISPKKTIEREDN